MECPHSTTVATTERMDHGETVLAIKLELRRYFHLRAGERKEEKLYYASTIFVTDLLSESHKLMFD